MIEDAPANAALDAPVSLTIDGLPVELTGFLARQTGDATAIRFRLSDQASDAVGKFLSARQAA